MNPTAIPAGNPPLAGLGTQSFLKDYWQKRPLLIRQALPGLTPPVDANGLLQMACDEAVESRLITAFQGKWRLEHGPFEHEQLPALSRKRWTLLVQGVDLHLDAAHRLLEKFRFIPDARVDDLMISLASDQGGVGPHVDAYDVFLLQIWGKRRWRVARPGNNMLKPGLPLKILEAFNPDEEWVLEPGDMLYLPPGWGHDGIAEGPCMTASIGFRAPSRHEFLREFLSAAADDPGGADPRFGDPGRSASRSHPAQIPTDLHRSLSAWARDWRPEPEQIERFIGRFLTEPKPSVWFESKSMPSTTIFTRRACRKGLRLDRRSRMMYRGNTLFMNGEDFAFEPAPFGWFRTLADQRELSASQCASALETPGFTDTVCAWFAHGWIDLGQGGSDTDPGKS